MKLLNCCMKLLVLLLCLMTSVLIAAEKPNILFILADDLGYGDVGCYNPDSKIPTPNPGSVAEEQPPIVLGVTNDGLYFLYDDDGERKFLPSEDEALAATLALTIKDPARDVMVYGDKKVEYGDVLRLLQALQQGMEKGKQVKLMTIISDGNG